MEAGRECFGIVQAARHHIDAVWLFVGAIGQRGPAPAAEAARNGRRGAEIDRFTLHERKCASGEHHERQHWCRGYLAAGAAVANAAADRLSFELVSGGPTKASALSHRGFLLWISVTRYYRLEPLARRAGISDTAASAGAVRPKPRFFAIVERKLP